MSDPQAPKTRTAFSGMVDGLLIGAVGLVLGVGAFRLRVGTLNLTDGWFAMAVVLVPLALFRIRRMARSVNVSATGVITPIGSTRAVAAALVPVAAMVVFFVVLIPAWLSRH